MSNEIHVDKENIGETTKPETTKPETAKPETAKPETTKPETAKPETTEPETAVAKPEKKSKPGAVFYAIGMVLAYMGVQLIFTIARVIKLAMDSLTEAGGDMVKYQQLYMEKVSEASEQLSRDQSIASIASALFVAILFYFIVYRKNKAEGKKNELKSKLFNRYGISFVACIIVAVLASVVLLQNLAVAIMPNMGEAISNAMSAVLGTNEILGIILAVVLAPIAEEMLVRGIIMKRAKKSFGMVGCIIITTFAFALLHGNPIQGMYVIPMGIFWGYLCYKYDSVIPGIICHFLHNLLVMFLPTSKIGIPVWAIIFSVAFVAVMITGKQLKKHESAMQTAA